MSEHVAVKDALQKWLEDLRTHPPQAWSAAELSGRASWKAVDTAVTDLAPASRRPDLYTKDGTALSGTVMIDMTGLGRVAEAFASGLEVPVEKLAADIAAFCLRDTPEVQTWVLLDIELPEGTELTLGDYRLCAASADDLVRLMPLPSMRRFLRPPSLDPDTLHGAAFLQLPRPDDSPYRGHFLLPDLDMRPERRHLDVLLTLQLWDPDHPLHPEAYFRVEPGRRSDLRSGAPVIEPRHDHYGEEVGESHRAYGYVVTDSELPTFTAFCTTVHTLVGAVRSRVVMKGNRRGDPTPTARALTSAASRLMRATQRTWGGTYVDEAEADDVLLDYVIAMEAVAAADGQGDSRRRTHQRAAALWDQDEARLAVAGVIKKAYELRSKYAHGEKEGVIHSKDGTTDTERLADIRRTAFGVFLRWLVTTDTMGEQVLSDLDRSLLSNRERHRVAEILNAFFTASPPATTAYGKN
ncbi:HEPN domain-containing protein [Streptomyces pini]|uniref:Uncharacterized protein n=1 Tax=Streptomyces pini TaxID=1520580 RepID=A0A1I4JME2_9ACTN|nr:HEPN domain-containing protein [Streptomyces pini]SFL67377.1 hypothetical protein SAMN05192584_12410 [Streptomyces pini]